MLDGTSLNRAHLVNKGNLWICSVNRVHLVKIGKSLWVTIYWAGPTNEGFSCFGILSSIELFVGSIQFKRWILNILSQVSKITWQYVRYKYKVKLRIEWVEQ